MAFSPLLAAFFGLLLTELSPISQLCQSTLTVCRQRLSSACRVQNSNSSISSNNNIPILDPKRRRGDQDEAGCNPVQIRIGVG